ncbi:MAG: putative rane protein [Armatimonadetes bacterium]|jgi:putative flippase GtrA|nr:putative rane protein [Armatimonadota bacterium]
MAVTHTASSMLQTVTQREGVRQFVKFLIVGASSTLIDTAIYLLLIERLHLQALVGSEERGRLIAQSISFAIAVTNGFFWNNKWTFQSSEVGGRQKRYAKFVLTNLVGLSLNLLILHYVAKHLVPASLSSLLHHYLLDPEGLIGKLVATAVVVFWNFTASKLWTFKR